MVDKEDNFNEFLNQQVEESHFEYSDAHWLKAEKLIAQMPAKKKPFWLFLGWGAASIFLLSTFFMIGYYTGKPKAAVHNLPSNSSAILPMNADKIPTLENTIKQSPTIETASNSQSVTNSNGLKKAQTESSFHQSVTIKKEVKSEVATFNSNKETVLVMQQKAPGNAAILRQPVLEQNSLIANVSETENLLVEEQISLDEVLGNEVVLKADEKVTEEMGNKDIDVNVLANCEANKVHNWMFDLVGGISDSRGFEGNSATTDKLGFGYFGGIRAAYKIDKNWFAAVQPILYSRGAINTKIESKKVDYDFGATQDEFVVKNKSLLFAELPILVGYRVGRHQVSAGAGFEYLINAKSDVKDFGSDTYKVNQWGYIDGFNRLGTMAIFNYSFKVYNNWCLNLMFQKGFTDFTKENYFTTNSKDKNLNLRIGFKYLINNQKKKAK